MVLVPQPLPWTVTAGREIAGGDGNVVQYTIANLGLICLAVNAHDALIAALGQAENWFRAVPASRCLESEILAAISAATGRIGCGALAARIEDAQAGSPDLDRKIASELQIPETAYTASIDAAMSLIPPGMTFSFSMKKQLDPASGSPADYSAVEFKTADGKTAAAASLTLPLAIAAAALKALDT
jgi:hypothetical protein